MDHRKKIRKSNDNLLRGILYPTDFTVASLGGLRIYLDRHTGEALRLFLVHGYMTPDSITELLFYSPSSQARMLAEDGFAEACEVLRNRYTFIATLAQTVFSGRNQAAFSNFVSGYGIHEAVLPQGYRQKSHNYRSFDLADFITASQLKITEIKAPEIITIDNQSGVANLFPGVMRKIPGH